MVEDSRRQRVWRKECGRVRAGCASCRWAAGAADQAADGRQRSPSPPSRAGPIGPDEIQKGNRSVSLSFEPLILVNV